MAHTPASSFTLGGRHLAISNASLLFSWHSLCELQWDIWEDGRDGVISKRWLRTIDFYDLTIDDMLKCSLNMAVIKMMRAH